MIDSTREHKYCVIGGGASGLVVARWLREEGIQVDIIERQDDVGGNWYFGGPHSSVYKSTHLLSSKRMTEFPDFPMPERYPDYPGQAQVHEYLKQYADHRVGFFAMHGEPSRLCLTDRHSVELSDLADLMAGRCEGRRLYFGSCSVPVRASGFTTKGGLISV